MYNLSNAKIYLGSTQVSSPPDSWKRPETFLPLSTPENGVNAIVLLRPTDDQVVHLWVSPGATIDWGDGSAPETAPGPESAPPRIRPAYEGPIYFEFDGSETTYTHEELTDGSFVYVLGIYDSATRAPIDADYTIDTSGITFTSAYTGTCMILAVEGEIIEPPAGFSSVSSITLFSENNTYTGLIPNGPGASVVRVVDDTDTVVTGVTYDYETNTLNFSSPYSGAYIRVIGFGFDVVTVRNLSALDAINNFGGLSPLANKKAIFNSVFCITASGNDNAWYPVAQAKNFRYTDSSDPFTHFLASDNLNTDETIVLDLESITDWDESISANFRYRSCIQMTHVYDCEDPVFDGTETVFGRKQAVIQVQFATEGETCFAPMLYDHPLYSPAYKSNLLQIIIDSPTLTKYYTGGDRSDFLTSLEIKRNKISNIEGPQMQLAYARHLEKLHIDCSSIKHIEYLTYYCTGLSDVALYNSGGVRIWKDVFRDGVNITDYPKGLDLTGAIQINNFIDEAPIVDGSRTFNCPDLEYVSNFFDDCDALKLGPTLIMPEHARFVSKGVDSESVYVDSIVASIGNYWANVTEAKSDYPYTWIRLYGKAGLPESLNDWTNITEGSLYYNTQQKRLNLTNLGRWTLTDAVRDWAEYSFDLAAGATQEDFDAMFDQLHDLTEDDAGPFTIYFSIDDYVYPDIDTSAANAKGWDIEVYTY
jgi:hypothetical protein